MKSSPFEWSGREIEAAYQSLVKAIAPWWDSLASLDPAGLSHDAETHGVRADRQRPFGDSEVPESGQALDTLLPELVAKLGNDSQVVGHPRYFAYVAGAANPVAPLAQALAMMLNPYTGTYTTAPLAVDLEDQTIRWLMTMMRWPKSGTGILTTGSSLAILSAVIAARESRPAPQGRRRLYVSDQAHHCFGKAFFGAGFLPEESVVIPSEDGRLNPELVRRLIREDKAKGLRPVLLVGTAGTTKLGRVDPLDALADIAAEEDLWFHVDGAYGGFFQLLDEAKVLKGLERGDSLSLDPHKAFCMPYGIGALLVRDVKALRWPRGLDASYMPPYQDEHMRLEYSDISPELSRDFRGLRLWLSLKVFGLSAFREHLKEKWSQARRFSTRLAGNPRFELATQPDLSLFAFRLAEDPRGERTKALFRAINASGEVFLTACEWQSKFYIRTCILSFRTRDEDLDALYERITEIEAKL